MDAWGEMQWYAVQSKPHQETLAAAAVAGLDLEVFHPRIRRERLVCGTRRMVSASLFAGYFFVRFCPLLSLDAVRFARGVLRVLGTSQGPIPLEESVMACLKERVQGDGFVRLERPSFHAGETVSIDQGPCAGWIGRVEREWDDGRRVAILLEAVQQTRILVDRGWLERVGGG